MNRKDFIDWKSSPITKALYNEVNKRIEGLKEDLSYSAGENAAGDRVKVGAIQAFRDVLDADWFEETEV